MGFNKRKSIPPAEVYNPFAYRSSSKATAAPSGEACDDLDCSDSSLDFSLNSGDIYTMPKRRKPATAMVYVVLVLSLFLVSLAAGLLYHLVVSSRTTALSNATSPNDDEFLTDDLVKKLAMENQFQQHEIEELKEELKEQLLAQERERQRVVQDRRREEEDNKMREEEDKTRQEAIRRVVGAKHRRKEQAHQRVVDMSNNLRGGGNSEQ